MDFFTTHFLSSEYYNSNSNASIQGQLSSSYEGALSDAVKQLADYVGFIYSEQPGVSLDDAKAVVEAISAGQFQLTGLQSSAQSKTGPVDGNLIQDPDPTVLVNGVSISIKDMLGGLDTESWKDAGKNGQWHTREFYTSAHEPHGYDPDWANPPKANEAPTASVLHFNATETQSTYDAAHVISNGAVDGHTPFMSLLEGASDPDGDVLTTSGYKFFDEAHNEIAQPGYITIDGNGNLVIDQNSRELDDLKEGVHLNLSVEYNIDDGHGHAISNTAFIDIVGTADIYKASGSDYVEQEHLRSDSDNGGGNLNGNVLSIVFDEAQNGGFDFTVTKATLTATETGLTGNEKITISDGTTIEFGGGAINLDASTTTKPVPLLDGALNDNKVDYNVGFNGQTDPTDSVTVGVKYDYDYWHWA
ncbi:hypothetical protein [Rhizobium sp. YTU87027]|uniref:hypothetical protein n=1 Tax=Rhizobium sp. YTU87027 TaxID=3417741 RepID=UPI003D69534B